MNIKHRLATPFLPVLSAAVAAPAMAQMAAGQRLHALCPQQLQAVACVQGAM